MSLTLSSERYQCRSNCRRSICRVTTIQALWKKFLSTIGHILPIFDCVILYFELFHCSATSSKWKNIGPWQFPQTARMVRISIFRDLLPLKLSGKEGRPQRPDMRRGHGNPASNNLPRRLTVSHILAVFTWARITFRKTFQNVIRPFPDMKAWF